jgi:hypothetical protein
VFSIASLSLSNAIFLLIGEYPLYSGAAATTLQTTSLDPHNRDIVAAFVTFFFFSTLCGWIAAARTSLRFASVFLVLCTLDATICFVMTLVSSLGSAHVANVDVGYHCRARCVQVLLSKSKDAHLVLGQLPYLVYNAYALVAVNSFRMQVRLL